MSDAARSAALGDALVRVTQTSRRDLPLCWDGERWKRGAPSREHRDVFGERLAQQPIGRGWYVWSASMFRADEISGGELVPPGRGGLCVDLARDDDTGFTVFVCAELWRQQVVRLNIPGPDVWEAVAASHADLNHVLAGVACHVGRDTSDRWALGLLATLTRLVGDAEAGR